MAKDLKKIEFTKSPTGRYGLGYSEGEQAEFSAEKAAELVEQGFAFYVVEETKKSKTADAKTAAAAQAEQEAKAAAAAKAEEEAKAAAAAKAEEEAKAADLKAEEEAKAAAASTEADAPSTEAVEEAKSAAKAK